jgi:hypothetical protein
MLPPPPPPPPPVFVFVAFTPLDPLQESVPRIVNVFAQIPAAVAAAAAAA